MTTAADVRRWDRVSWGDHTGRWLVVSVTRKQLFSCTYRLLLVDEVQVWAVCNLRPWLVRRRVPGSTSVWIEGAK